MAIVALIAAASFFPGCKRSASHQALTGEETVLSIGEREVSVREFYETFDRAKLEQGIAGDPAASSVLKSTLVAEMVKTELIVQHAKAIGMTVQADEVSAEIGRIRAHYPGESFREMLAEQYVAYDEWIERQKVRMLVEKVVAEELENKIVVTDLEARTWFDAHVEIAGEPERVKVSQILVATEAEAKLIKGRLDKGEDFAELAREKSMSPEGREGGVLGVFAPGQVPSGMDLVFKLIPGVPSGVVQSEYGFHVFKVLEHTPNRILSFEEVKPKVVEKVKAAKVEQAFPGWLAQLAIGVKVQRNDAILAAIE